MGERALGPSSSGRPQKQPRGWLGLSRNWERQKRATGPGALHKLLSAWVAVSGRGGAGFLN